MESHLPLPRRIWWPWNQPASRVGFVRVFSVSQTTGSVLYLSASGPYQVWLDEIRLQEPESNSPAWRDMHRIPVQLIAGVHQLVICAEPGQHGIPFTMDPIRASSALWEEIPTIGQPYLLACLDWSENGQNIRIATDANWRMCHNPPAGWPEDPDNVELFPAWAFDGVWAEPWGMPCNTPEDFCRLNHGWQALHKANLTQVVDQSTGLSTLGGSVCIQENGTIRMKPVKPYPLDPPRFSTSRMGSVSYFAHAAQDQMINTWLDLFEARAPYVVFSSTGEAFARVKVTLLSGGPAIVAITTGESIGEIHRYARRRSHVFRLENGQSFVTAPVGLLYVKVMVLSTDSDAVVLAPVELQRIEYDQPVQGTFSCSDPQINAIWKASARTLALCMQNEIWDGIKRDQLPWMGDLYVEALAAYHLYGDASLARHTLAVLSEMGPGQPLPLSQQRYPGLRAAWQNSSGDINTIPTYTMWWVIGLADYFRYTGDRSLIEEVSEPLISVLRHIAAHLDENFIWNFQRGFDFVDWSPISPEERLCYTNLLAAQVLAAGANLLKGVKRSPESFDQLAQAMRAAVHHRWDLANWRFASSHHLPALFINTGWLPKAGAKQLFAQTLFEDAPLNMTFWHRYLDLAAAGRVGETQWGLNYMRRHWGPALKAGTDTFWEVFDQAWLGADAHRLTIVSQEYADYGGYGTSLCHGWSAGPCAWLPQAVLGVVPHEPGFTSITFQPALADLDWAEGVIPTPHGSIEIELVRSKDDKCLSNICVPNGIKLIPS